MQVRQSELKYDFIVVLQDA